MDYEGIFKRLDLAINDMGGLLDIEILRENAITVGSLAELCKKMKINTIAEGIETEEQFKLIKELGVNEAQGFLFSKPIPLEDFEKMYLKLFQDK